MATALAFDFTNGFHDTANAMATSVATGALKPKAAVALVRDLESGWRLPVDRGRADGEQQDHLHPGSERGARAGSDGRADAGDHPVPGLSAASLWNLVTWLFGLPSSSSHALFGGLIGATIAAIGLSGVKWDGVITAIVLPAVFCSRGRRVGRRPRHLAGLQDRDKRAGTAAG